MTTSKVTFPWAIRRARLGRWWRQWQSEEVVFGRPEWFAKKPTGWGIAPTRIPGWIYMVVWSLVVMVPFLMLVVRHRPPEAAIWLMGSLAMLIWDVRKLARAVDARSSWPLGETAAGCAPGPTDNS